MLTRASCAKAVVAANAANSAASNGMRYRYPNISKLLHCDSPGQLNAYQLFTAVRHLVCRAVEALMPNDSWMGFALQPINSGYPVGLSVTFSALRNRGNEGDSAGDF